MAINIDRTLYKGRPLDTSGRTEREIRTYDLLDSLGIEYERIDHDAADTIEECLEVESLLGTVICKNLFLCTANKSQFYLLMMPGTKPFKTKELSKQIGSTRLSFAPAEYMEQYLGLTPGSVSILGLMNDTDKKVTLLIDEDVLKDEYLGCHPCMNTSSLKVKTEDIIKKFLPEVGHFHITVNLTGEV